MEYGCIRPDDHCAVCDHLAGQSAPDLEKIKTHSAEVSKKRLKHIKKQKAVKLPDIRFFDRFRLRIILQNKSSYITLFVGIVFANILLCCSA